MPRICFVPGCKTSSRCKQSGNNSTKPGEKLPALFSAPKDPVLRKQWHIASKRADREMTVRDFVCELHFTEDCIERYYITDLGGGEVFKLERGCPKLIKGSIPTIFSFSKSTRVSKYGRPIKKCLAQNKENGIGNFGSRKKSTTPKFPKRVIACSAYGCTNSSDMNIPGLSFHRFPNKTTRRSWLNSVGKKFFKSSNKSVLCSAHFSSDQIKQTSTSAVLRPEAIPTIFSEGMKWPSADLKTDFSDSDGNESFSGGFDDNPAEDSSEEEPSATETIYVVQEENDGKVEDMSSSHRNILLKQYISKNFIAEGYEEVFGKFVANELRILSCDSPLYLRTKEKIWRVLEEASQICAT